MKRIVLLYMGLSLLSCDMLGPGKPAAAEEDGQLRIAFAPVPTGVTKSEYEIPDTSDFIKKVIQRFAAVAESLDDRKN